MYVEIYLLGGHHAVVVQHPPAGHKQVEATVEEAGRSRSVGRRNEGGGVRHIPFRCGWVCG